MRLAAVVAQAVDRLLGIPLWVFHCADDAIFPVACSDKLVRTMRAANGSGAIGRGAGGGAAAAAAEGDAEGDGSCVRYSRFDRDQVRWKNTKRSRPASCAGYSSVLLVIQVKRRFLTLTHVVFRSAACVAFCSVTAERAGGFYRRGSRAQHGHYGLAHSRGLRLAARTAFRQTISFPLS